ncbi:uncharacterized protein LOC123405611 [Hordeum vulgare subsp. vulgare]|uniref:uncharacterized protein LOC123405611 n=1 Tax=Hordeum vulgare subsp. vulgare TaxID=112509 RepID=UPI001D1A54DF|nr:uncharacterized protein LOC123405611 [Hordeum vulgare subsp. vulgare]
MSLCPNRLGPPARHDTGRALHGLIVLGPGTSPPWAVPGLPPRARVPARHDTIRRRSQSPVSVSATRSTASEAGERHSEAASKAPRRAAVRHARSTQREARAHQRSGHLGERGRSTRLEAASGHAVPYRAGPFGQVCSLVRSSPSSSSRPPLPSPEGRKELEGGRSIPIHSGLGFGRGVAGGLSALLRPDPPPPPPLHLSAPHLTDDQSRTAEHRRAGEEEMMMGMINANQVVHERPERASHLAHAALDTLDVFDTVRDIKDPEHPYSLATRSGAGKSQDKEVGRS